MLSALAFALALTPPALPSASPVRPSTRALAEACFRARTAKPCEAAYVEFAAHASALRRDEREAGSDPRKAAALRAEIAKEGGVAGDRLSPAETAYMLDYEALVCAYFAFQDSRYRSDYASAREWSSKALALEPTLARAPSRREFVARMKARSADILMRVRGATPPS